MWFPTKSTGRSLGTFERFCSTSPVSLVEKNTGLVACQINLQSINQSQKNILLIIVRKLLRAQIFYAEFLENITAELNEGYTDTLE